MPQKINGEKKMEIKKGRYFTIDSEFFKTCMGKAHTASKCLKSKTCNCAACGSLINWNGENCYSFGVYLCQECFQDRQQLEDFYEV